MEYRFEATESGLLRGEVPSLDVLVGHVDQCLSGTGHEAAAAFFSPANTDREQTTCSLTGLVANIGGFVALQYPKTQNPTETAALCTWPQIVSRQRQGGRKNIKPQGDKQLAKTHTIAATSPSYRSITHTTMVVPFWACLASCRHQTQPQQQLPRQMEATRGWGWSLSHLLAGSHQHYHHRHR